MSSWLLNGTASGFGNEGRIYWDNQLLATRDWNGQTYFHHADYLGTERLRTDYAGNVANVQHSLASGELFSQSSTDIYGAMQDNAQFTGQEYDAETGTDHFQFRQYAPTQGRWMSPDPYDGSYDYTNPQSFNRYAYVLNNPLSLTDPDGEDTGSCQYDACVSAGSGGCQYDACVSGDPFGGNVPWFLQEYGWYGYNFWSHGSGLSGGYGGSTPSAPPPSQPVPPPAPNNGEPPSPCLAANIAALNQVSNLNVNMSNVVGQPFIYNGGLDVNFSVPGGSPSQLPVGRYPSSILGRIFGFGASLHVPGQGGADPSTYGVDANGNFTFTTHIDSAYSTWHTPIGALIHFFTDVRGQGAHRKPC